MKCGEDMFFVDFITSISPMVQFCKIYITGNLTDVVAIKTLLLHVNLVNSVEVNNTPYTIMRNEIYQ